MASSSTASRPAGRIAYDVFLSFRGDTRKKFTDHLYTALIQAGINTFRDDDKLPRGEDISFQLGKAIRESKISIVVFSKGYASSRWCLEELATILECKNTQGQIVFPIFYDVDPSDVRNQTGPLAEAFERHKQRFKQEMEKVNKWRQVLKEAANLSGWDLQNVANGHESKFIKKVVEDVSRKLDHKYLNVPTHLIGIDSCVNNLIVSLTVGMNDVRIFGIHGMGGIGKTTLAKVVFNQLCCRFEGSSCLLNIKETSEQPDGLVRLQEQLLCDILTPEILKISNVDRGINLIKERLCHKRVLLVLDDLDQLRQLNALVGERNWFGPGSRIIVTTRDEHLLTQLEADEKYRAKELNRNESLQLFSWHAFKDTHPIKDYVELSNGIIDYVGGLPLALEVLGSYLFKRSISEWKAAIEKLRKIPHHQIQRKLRISFDTLDDDKVKSIFLDIACFFVGMDKEYVAQVLDGRGFFPEIGISVLIERSLVTINDQNELRMHDLIRDMGREIIREMSHDHPGKRSRLWFLEDVLDVLKKQMGTKVVEGLMLDVRGSKIVWPVSTESFAKMRYLKLLQINGVHLTGCYQHLSKELIWLCWHGCPLKSLPPNFQLDNLVVLDLQCSKIREVWKEIKVLDKLKILNLSYSVYLGKTPNFSGFASLERLILQGCTSLVEVHQSIGNLGRLVFLNLHGCKSIKNLPESICYLKSLETLNISCCSKLEKLPEHLGNMEALTELVADGTAIKQLPHSIGHLKKLTYLSLRGYKQGLPSTSWFSRFSSWLSPRSSSSKALLPISFAGLSSLRKLDLSYFGLSEDATSIDLGGLSSLQELNLTESKFFNMPRGIGSLPKLGLMILNRCKNLQLISELPSSLRTLYADDCTSMERLLIQTRKAPDRLYLGGCEKLAEIQGLEHVENSPEIVVYKCNKFLNNFKKRLLQVLSERKLPDICLTGGEIPDWFSHRGDGSSLSFYVPAVSGSEIQGLIVWVSVINNCDGFLPSFNIKNKSNDLELIHTPSSYTNFSASTYNSWMSHIPFCQLPCSTEGGEELELSVGIDGFAQIMQCGVHLIVNEPEAVNRQGTMVPSYTSSSSDENFVAGRVEKLDVVGKRGRDNDEAEPSNKEGCSKKLKMEPDV